MKGASKDRSRPWLLAVVVLCCVLGAVVQACGGGDSGDGGGGSTKKVDMAAELKKPANITVWAWTPGTDGPVRGDVIVVPETTSEDLQKYIGKLKGKWVLGQAAPDVAARPRSSAA